MSFLKSKQVTTAIVFALISLGIKAQENKEEESKKGMQITAFNIDFGFYSSSILLTNDDYFKMKNSAVDQSEFISNPEDYNIASYSSNTSGGFAPSASLSFTPYSKKKGALNYNHEFRIKLGGSFGNNRSFYYYRDETHPYDTLSSAIGNPDIIIDSVYFDSPSYVETINEINIGLSYLFKTNAAKRVYIYAGIGAEYGLVLQDYVTTVREDGYYLKNNSDDFYVAPYHDENTDQFGFSSTKTKLTSNTHFIRMYIPLGINFRIANNNNFFKHINIYTQFSPGVEIQIVTGVETYTNPFIGVAVVGLRYTID